MHSYNAVMKNVDKYLKTTGTCELKGTRYIDYSQVPLTTMETSVRMLYVILACYNKCTPIVLTF